MSVGTLEGRLKGGLLVFSLSGSKLLQLIVTDKMTGKKEGATGFSMAKTTQPYGNHNTVLPHHSLSYPALSLWTAYSPGGSKTLKRMHNVFPAANLWSTPCLFPFLVLVVLLTI